MQIWPYGAWFGLTRRRLQAFGVFIAGSLGLLVVLYGATRLLLFIETRRATALLSQLNNVKLGEKETAVHPILQRYEDLWDQHEIGAEGDNYTLRVDPGTFTVLLVRFGLILLFEGGSSRLVVSVEGWGCEFGL